MAMINKAKKHPWRRIKSFSMTDADEALLMELQHRISLEVRLVTESEVIRAGLQALHTLSGGEVAGIFKSVPRLVPGRERGFKTVF